VCPPASKLREEWCCPVCHVTLWQETVQQHYQQELARLAMPTSARVKKKRSSQSGKSSQAGGRTEGGSRKLIQDSQQVNTDFRKWLRVVLHRIFQAHAIGLYVMPVMASLSLACKYGYT